jgi:hypothetical protein
MPKTDGKPKKYSKAEIRKGLQQLKVLYKHDYRSPMPKLLVGAGFASDVEAERLGRLFGVALKKPVAKAVKINPASSNTNSHFGYQFDLKKLKAPAFARSRHGKIYAALLEQTKYMKDQRAKPEMGSQIGVIYRLPPGKRSGSVPRARLKLWKNKMSCSSCLFGINIRQTR